jgi:alkylation response protein AidB-like acyl-CoA dehydrogenase
MTLQEAAVRNRVDQAFLAAVESGSLELPLPGSGRTRLRWAALSRIAEEDLSLVRLCEGHVDAVAILDELDGPVPPPGSRWGVWAARPPGDAVLRAQSGGAAWVLQGRKPFCSGARVCTHALVTAEAEDGYRLFAVELDRAGVRPVPGTWSAIGMADSDSLDVEFDRTPAFPVGKPGAYLDRPGLWHGALGVAACWYGGAVGVAHTLAAAASAHELGPHVLAHLGAVDALLTGLAMVFDAAATAVDADPRDEGSTAQRLAAQVRALTEAGATQVLDRTGRALGARPLCHDAAHARRVADLTVYLRQSHAERSLAELGKLAAAGGTTW